MDTQQRTAAMAEAITQLAREGEGFVIFTDAAQPENFVQLTSDGLLEATSRNYRSSSLPRLSEAQVDELVGLGFSRAATPNHQRPADLSQPDALASLAELVFTILGALPDFELDIETGV